MKGRQEIKDKVIGKLEKILIETPELRGYLDYLLLVGKSHHTVNVYIRGAQKYLEYLGVDKLEDVKSANLDAFIRFINGDRMKYYEIRFFYRYLIINGYADKNLADYVDAPKDKKEHKVVSLTLDEIGTVKRNIFKYDFDKKQCGLTKYRDFAIIMLALTTGLRVGSIIELNLEDLNTITGELTITEKGNKTRTIYLSKDMMSIINMYLLDRKELLKSKKDDVEALFISTRRQRIAYRTVNEMLEKYTEGIGKHITPHKLRSTCATILYEHTKDVMVVKDTLGHQDVKTTMRYIGDTEERLKKSSSVMSNVLF